MSKSLACSAAAFSAAVGAYNGEDTAIAVVPYGQLAPAPDELGEKAVGDNVDALTGATVTSKAVVKAVNSASAFVTGADVSSSATEWGG